MPCAKRKNIKMAFTSNLYHDRDCNKIRHTNPFVWKQRSVCIYFAPQFVQKRKISMSLAPCFNTTQHVPYNRLSAQPGLIENIQKPFQQLPRYCRCSQSTAECRFVGFLQRREPMKLAVTQEETLPSSWPRSLTVSLPSEQRSTSVK